MTLLLLLELILRKTPGNGSANGPEKTVVLFRAKETASKTTCYCTSNATLTFLRAAGCTMVTSTIKGVLDSK